MSFETYKIRSIGKKGYKRLYTLSELHSMELPALRAVCRDERIIPESLNVFNDKNETIELIFGCRGAASDPYINKLTKDGIQRLKAAIEAKGESLSGGEINVPAHLKIYKKVESLNEQGREYSVISDFPIGQTNALLVDTKNDIYGIIHISESRANNRYLLSLKRDMLDTRLKTGIHKNFSLIFFPKDFENVLRIYNNTAEKIPRFAFVRSPIRELSVNEIEETDDVLVIDYGTSFTTAGTYVDGKIKRVRFISSDMCEHDPDVPANLALCHNCGRCELCPSVIAVKTCSDEHVEFVYGNEAKNRLPIARNSVFFDTKRWVNNYKEVIEVTDLNGHTICISRSVIIEMFLNYVISVAEQQNKKQYKNICFTSPVKQKALSIKMYHEVLKGYNVVLKDTIDEAVSVVYESVAEEVEKFEYNSGVNKRVLLIDCGGGTSDMVNCDYIITRNVSRSDIQIKVGYTNGDTNFGGNNLTYRIMQYIKIKLAQYYRGQKIKNIDELLDVSSADIYDYVDTYGLKKLYEKFDEAYVDAGGVIPTAFDEYKNEVEFIFLDVRGNFFFLWSLAERIKIEFYNHIGSYYFGFMHLKTSKKLGSSMLKYTISVKHAKTGELETHTALPDIQISRDEINLLIKPEIYGLLKNFIEKYYKDGTLHDVDGIKLSGQTTKIDMFRDVLKEYIEGRKSRVPFESSFSKKLKCINGAISYHGAKIIGRINAKIEYESAIVPYHLTVETFNKDEPEKTLILRGQKLSDIYGYVDRTVETEVVTFALKDKDGKILHHKNANISVNDFRLTDYEELPEIFDMRSQSEVDRIPEDIIRLFIFSADDSWGFNLIGLSRYRGQLCRSEVVYFPFENTEWELNFFDGTR